MPRLWVPDRTIKRLKPPLGAQVNWGHPLTRDLCLCYIFNERAGVNYRDFSKFCHQKDANYQTIGWNGRGIDLPGTNDENFTITARKAGPATTVSACTMLTSAWRSSITHTATTVVNYGMVADTNWAISLGANVVSTIQVPYIFTGDQTINSTLATWANTDLSNYHTFGFAQSASNVRTFFLDGATEANTTNLNNHPTTSGISIGAFYSNGALAANTGWQGGIEWVYCWTRCISVAELLLVYSEPFAFFRMPKKISYSVPSGAPAQSQSPRTMHQFRLRRA
jgi:hypothetical protein